MLSPARQRWMTANSVEHRNKLVEEHIETAKKIARKWDRLSHLDYSELESSALEHLIEAIEKFDPSKGVPLHNFLIKKINWGVLNDIRDKGNLVKIPRREYDLNQKSKRVERQLEIELGRKVTSVELAFKMGIDHAKLNEAKTAMSTCKKMGAEEILHFREGGSDQMESLELHADWNALTEREKRAVNLFFNNSNKSAANLLQIELEELFTIVKGAIAKVRIGAVLSA